MLRSLRKITTALILLCVLSISSAEHLVGVVVRQGYDDQNRYSDIDELSRLLVYSERSLQNAVTDFEAVLRDSRRSSVRPSEFELANLSAVFDFSISVTPSSGTVTAGKALTPAGTVTLSLLGSPSQSVSLSLSGLPPSVGVDDLTGKSCTPSCSISFGIGTFSGASPGTYTLTITGSGGSKIHSTTYRLTVSGQTSPFDFSISASPSSGSVTAGRALTNAGTVTLNLLSGTTQSVSLSLSGLPPSVGVDDLTGKSCAPTCSISFGIGTFVGASPGTYTLTITGTGGGKTHSTTYRLTVNPSDSVSFDFSMSVSPSSGSVVAGKALTNAGTVTLNLISGSIQSVSLSLSGLPQSVGVDDLSGKSCSPTCSISFGIGTFPGASPGTYTLTITGTGAGKTHSTIYRLTVTPSDAGAGFDFSISVSPGSGSVAAGKALTNAGTVTLTLLSGTTQSVTLSLTGLPPSVGVDDLTGKSCSPTCSITFGIGTFAGAQTGTYTLTITGTGGGKTHSANYALSVAGSITTVGALAASVRASPASGPAPLTVQFTSSATGGVQPYSYSWDLGDGGTSTTQNPTHVYTNAGVYLVRLTVRDNAGSTAFDSTSITVTSVVASQFCLRVSSIPTNVDIGGAESVSGCYPAGTLVQLLAPGFFADRVFWYWKVDGRSSFENTNPRASINMDRDHTLVANYIARRDLTVIMDDVGKAISLLSNVDDMVRIVKATKAGEKYYKIAVEFSPRAAQIMREFGEAVPYIEFGFDVGVIAYQLLDDSKPPQQKLDYLGNFIAERSGELVGIVGCVLISSLVFTPLGGFAVCTLGAEMGVEIAKHKDTIISKIRSFFSDLKNSIQSILSWLYKQLLQVLGGSSVGLLVIDPSGRRVGAVFENGRWMVLQEIPNAYYSGLDSHPQYIAIPNPNAGIFRVVVTGNQAGNFLLNTTMTVSGEVTSVQNLPGNVEQGTSKEHQILLTPEDGRTIVNPSTLDIIWYGARQDLALTLSSAAITAIVVLLSSEILLRRRRSYRKGRKRR